MSKTTQALTLTEFLLARIAEDETEARGLLADWDSNPPSVYDVAQVGYLEAGTPERVLADCDAKRQVVEYATGQHTGSQEGWDILGILALPYAEHPDYREAWKP